MLVRQTTFAGVLAGLALIAGFLMAGTDYNVQGVLLVALALVILGGFLLIPKMARGTDLSFLLKLLLVAFAAKMAGGAIRIMVTERIYGFQDVARYHSNGAAIANSIRHLDFDTVAGFLQFGTQFTMFYTGVVYTLIGPSLYGGFLVFGFLAFIGSFFFYKAFRVAFPDTQPRFYVLLVFLFPSILYWSNGIGKDALMALFMGLAAYGSALLLKRTQFNGFVPLILGLAGTVTVRPHVAGMLVIGLMAAFFLRRSGTGYRSLLIKGIILVAGMLLVWSFATKLLSYVGLQEISVDATVEFYSVRQTATSKFGGSTFEAPELTDPLFLPIAFVTVLFRPFPWEAHNLQALIQSIDGMLLMGLMLWRAPSLSRAILRSGSDPYVIYIVAVVSMLVIGLITIANFGTLARERAMLLPLLLMLIAFSPNAKPKKNSLLVERTS